MMARHRYQVISLVASCALLATVYGVMWGLGAHRWLTMIVVAFLAGMLARISRAAPILGPTLATWGHRLHDLLSERLGTDR